MDIHPRSRPHPPPGPGPGPLATMTARCPEDLLAFVPIALGFAPRESVVLLTLGPGAGFHARVDRPSGPDQVALVTEALVDGCRRHSVERVAVVVYADDGPAAARPVVERLHDRLAEEGIAVLVSVCADGRRWWPLDPGRPAGPPVAYDVSAHPFLAESVVAGLVTHGSRDELAATLRPVAACVAAVAARLASTVAPDAAWVHAVTSRHAAAGTVPDAADLARLVAAVADPVAREGAWCAMSRADARAHVDLWTAVLRSAPVGHEAGPAAVLAFAAWLSGHGALAWCAVERALAADPACTLADTVSGLLVSATSPTGWRPPGWPPVVSPPPTSASTSPPRRSADPAHQSGGAGRRPLPLPPVA